MISLNVNGKNYRVDVSDDTPLLWVIRDHLKLMGTKFGCGIGECGACTVHINGKAQRSCVISVGEVKGKKITTIEGLPNNHPVKRAWIEEQVPQCGFCQSGMIMSALALLQRVPTPSDADIDAAMANICRCGTFQQVRAAIHAAAKA